MGCRGSTDQRARDSEGGSSLFPNFKAKLQGAAMNSAPGQKLLREKFNAALAIGDPDRNDEPSAEEIQAHEFKAWSPKSESGDDYPQVFKDYRPYSCKGYVEKSPAVGGKAPDGKVHSILADGSVGPEGSLVEMAQAL